MIKGDVSDGTILAVFCKNIKYIFQKKDAKFISQGPLTFLDNIQFFKVETNDYAREGNNCKIGQRQM